MRPLQFIHRLGPHHFAHLRAVAEGIPLLDSVHRYLGIAHGHEAATAHRQTVDLVRAIARRKGDKAWRLVGVEIRIHEPILHPALSDFIADQALEDWSESEQLALYEASYPTDTSAQAKVRRRQTLRQRQLHLLRALELSDATQPKTEDMVSGWYDDRTATKLLHAGYINLGELQHAIAVGGRWYRALPGIGRVKAQRIEAHLQTLLPGFKRATLSLGDFPALEALGAPKTPQRDAPLDHLEITAHKPAQEVGFNRVWGQNDAASLSIGHKAPPNGSLLNASNDLEAVRTWVQAHAGSAATVKSFWRAARTFLLWLQAERNNLRFAELKVNDCLAFKAFIENIPPRWISRNRVKPGLPGWAPFRGPLSEASRHHLLNIVGAMFAYLKLANYLQQNPWPLIKTRAGMKKSAVSTLDTKAFTAEAQDQITQFIAECPRSPAQARMCFIVNFLATVGLRSSELLAATIVDIRRTPYGHALEVRGKGGKHRVVALPPAAITAINTYLQSRGWSDIACAPPHAPLLASTKNAMESISYQALYLTVRGWLGKAIEQAAIPEIEKRSLRGATTHWFRHTFATRAIERDVPMEVVQAQLGHSSVNTTMNTYAKASLRRQLSGISLAFK